MNKPFDSATREHNLIRKHLITEGKSKFVKTLEKNSISFLNLVPPMIFHGQSHINRTCKSPLTGLRHYIENHKSHHIGICPEVYRTANAPRD